MFGNTLRSHCCEYILVVYLVEKLVAILVMGAVADYYSGILRTVTLALQVRIEWV